jgi:hypothetical protein
MIYVYDIFVIGMLLFAIFSMRGFLERSKELIIKRLDDD